MAPVLKVGIEGDVPRVARAARIEGRRPVVAAGARIVEIALEPGTGGGKVPSNTGCLAGGGAPPLTFSVMASGEAFASLEMTVSITDEPEFIEYTPHTAFSSY